MYRFNGVLSSQKLGGLSPTSKKWGSGLRTPPKITPMLSIASSGSPGGTALVNRVDNVAIRRRTTRKFVEHMLLSFACDV